MSKPWPPTPIIKIISVQSKFDACARRERERERERSVMFTKISVTDTSQHQHQQQGYAGLIKYKHISHKNKPLASSLGAVEGSEERGGGWAVRGGEWYDSR